LTHKARFRNISGSLPDKMSLTRWSCALTRVTQAVPNFRGSIMYAVIKTGGKQYKVSAGEKLRVEQLAADVGAELVIDQVLAVGSGDQFAIGSPLVSGASVSVTVLSHGRGDKVRIFKMRRRKHYQKRQGHRQNYTELFIGKIASELGSVNAELPQAAA
jgi:large subunit ribosomal protein L21